MAQACTWSWHHCQHTNWMWSGYTNWSFPGRHGWPLSSWAQHQGTSTAMCLYPHPATGIRQLARATKICGRRGNTMSRDLATGNSSHHGARAPTHGKWWLLSHSRVVQTPFIFKDAGRIKVHTAVVFPGHWDSHCPCWWGRIVSAALTWPVTASSRNTSSLLPDSGTIYKTPLLSVKCRGGRVEIYQQEYFNSVQKYLSKLISEAGGGSSLFI